MAAPKFTPAEIAMADQVIARAKHAIRELIKYHLEVRASVAPMKDVPVDMAVGALINQLRERFDKQQLIVLLGVAIAIIAEKDPHV